MKRSALFKTALFTVLLIIGVTNSTRAQNKKLSGTVTELKADGTSSPLVGVNVILKGTTTGTVTDAKGKFSIEAPSTGTLVFSSIGYTTVEIKVGNRTTLSIQMKEDAQMLEDLVVVGYGVQRRSDVTGAVTSIKPEEMKIYPTNNVSEMLRGKAAGVFVRGTSGRPGDTPSITIRGERSLGSGGNAPLYIIDGAPATATEFAAINGADIASLEILKDAAAQAVYGSRAANGVILVTTIRGQKGKPTVKFRSMWSWQDLWRNFDFYSPEEYYNLRAEAQAHDKENGLPTRVDPSTLTPTDVLTDNMMERAYAAGRSTDWEKLMFQTALSQKYDLSISGGTDKMRIAASMGYVDQDGMVVTGSGYQRANVRVNVDYDVYKWLSVGFNSSFIKSKKEKESGNFTDHITRSPYAMPFDEYGNIQEYINDSGDKNPFYLAERIKNDVHADITRLNGFIDIKPFKGFSYRFNAAYYNRYQEEGSYKKADYTGGGAAGSISHSKSFNYVVENIFNYKVPFKNKNHSMNVTALQSWERTYTTGLGYASNNVPVDSFWWDMIADGEVTSKTRSVSEHILLGFMGRIQYGFKDRYLLNVIVRRDGSSRFGPRNRWGTFPSVAGAWRISEEPFMKKANFISNLKLRVSYGIVGNQDGIGNYETLGTTTDYKMEFGDNFIMGYLPGNSLPNPALKWESTASTNFGLDFGFFDNRLTGTVEYYLTRTKNLLVSRQINSVLGYTGMMDNLGKTSTNGVDITLNGDIIRNNKMNWSIGTNFTLYRNKILKIDGKTDENGNPVNDITNGWFIGQPKNIYYVYQSDGIFQESDFNIINGKWVLKPTIDSDGDGIPDKTIERTDLVEPGKIKIVDRNGDGKITADDRYIVPRAPKFIMSLFTNFNFKGFDLYMEWYGVYGRKIKNAYLYDSNSGGSLQGKQNGIKVNYWTPENPSGNFPRPSYNSNTTYQTNSDLVVQDASYIRLRTLSVGYTVPSRLTQKIKIQNLRVYCTFSNLFTSTKFLSYSPENTAAAYPEPRQYAFGIDLSF